MLKRRQISDSDRLKFIYHHEIQGEGPLPNFTFVNRHKSTLNCSISLTFYAWVHCRSADRNPPVV